jgi:hypothetical protein
MSKVCKITKDQSPLCGDWELLKRIDILAESRGLETDILLGISYAESKL